MAQQTVALYQVKSGRRAKKAHKSLAEALGEAEIGEPDDAGSFDISIDAESPQEAREIVRDALARAGTGADFVLRESTEGREIPPDDPRQGGDGKPEATAKRTRTRREAAAEKDGESAETMDAAAAETTRGPAAETTEEPTGEAPTTGEAETTDEGEAAPDPAARVLSAADAVAAAASKARSGDTDAAKEAAKEAASAAREAASEAASSVRSTIDEKGVGGAASDYAGQVQQSQWQRFAPIGGLLLLLMIVRRRRRRRRRY